MLVKCGVCDTLIAKYKCPSCQLHSCSVECYKSHQATHANVSLFTTPQSILNGLFPKPPAPVVSTGASNSNANSSGLSGTRSPSPLESSAHLQILYTRYPLLRDRLREIYEAATEPLKDQQNDPLFSREFSHRGRGRGRIGARDGRTTATWSRHNGIHSGIHRLRMLRHSKGEDGDGLKEFSNLVTGGPLEARKSIIVAP